jgi:hypothetical protein
VWAAWRSPADAQADYAQAMADGDYLKAAKINDALAAAQAYGQQQQFKQLVEDVIQSKLGDVLPSVRETAAERMLDEDKSLAMGQLKAAGVDIAPLLEASGTFEVEGNQYPDSPLNRVLAQFPDLLEMYVNHPDPRKARQLTFIRRWRMAASLLSQLKPAAGTAPPAPGDPGTAPAPAAQPAGGSALSLEAGLAEARQAMAQREEQDRVRQGLNAGPGASSGSGVPGAQSFADSLKQTGGTFLDEFIVRK